MAGYVIEFKDEYDKQDLVEKAQAAKETVCDLWDALAHHVPELHQLQERRYYNRSGYGMNGPAMGTPGGWNGHVGYREYPVGMTGSGAYRDGNGIMAAPSMGGYPHYRENPAWTGPGDRRGY